MAQLSHGKDASGSGPRAASPCGHAITSSFLLFLTPQLASCTAVPDCSLRRCVVLFSPTAAWTAQLSADAVFAGRCLAAIDAGLAQADALPPAPTAEGEERQGGSLSVASTELPTELAGVFSTPLAVSALVILGQLDPNFESGREMGTRIYAHARMAQHGEGAKIPQEPPYAELVVDFLRQPAATAVDIL